MDEMLARRKLAEGSDRGKIGADGRWAAQIQPMRDAPSSLGLSTNWELKEVALAIIVRDGDRDRQIDLKTLRLAKKSDR
jgi:hypothetical protein